MRLPDRFGEFGGMFVPELLVGPLEQLEQAFIAAMADNSFRLQLADLLHHYAGRPTPLTRCRQFCADSPLRVFLKREDLLHGGAHKTNQVLAQALLAKRIGKSRIIAETGAGQHGVATAFACALLGLECRIYMGETDCRRQQQNVFRMELFGATVTRVTAGAGTLKEAVNEALRDWAASHADTHYLLGTAAGPHPYPTMVREFQRIIGEEARAQILAQTGRLPDAVVACVGGGSNAIGMFANFINDKEVQLIGVEAAGKGLASGSTGAKLSVGTPGILHGAFTQVMQLPDGQIDESYSLSAGLDYPAVGPEHAYLQQIGRAEYVSASDAEAVAAFRYLCRSEGIMPALESAHALAHVMRMAQAATREQIVIVNLSGRGDKDIATIHDFATAKIGTAARAGR